MSDAPCPKCGWVGAVSTLLGRRCELCGHDIPYDNEQDQHRDR